MIQATGYRRQFTSRLPPKGTAAFIHDVDNVGNFPILDTQDAAYPPASQRHGRSFHVPHPSRDTYSGGIDLDHAA
ncbi:MAG: hypothetical protein FPO08_16375 [Geobacter sp.]|nr:MAG: hypothetical protein FPO08_16375 [Geobacter sp.]